MTEFISAAELQKPTPEDFDRMEKKRKVAGLDKMRQKKLNKRVRSITYRDGSPPTIWEEDL